MKINKIISIILALFIFTACHTAKKAVEKPIVKDTSVPTVFSTADMIKKLQKNQPYFKTANASKMSIDVDVSGRQLSVSAACQIVSDSAIHLSVMPLFGYELYKLEITPQGFILIDKFNKRYYEESYSYIENRFGVAVTFDDIQSLISNQLFLVDKKSYLAEDFVWKNNDPSSMILVSKRVKTEQETIIDSMLLNRIAQIIVKSAEYNSILTINYADFQEKNTILFPHKIALKAEQNGIKKAQFDFDIEKIKFNEPLSLKSINLAKYTRGDINSLLKK